MSKPSPQAQELLQQSGRLYGVDGQQLIMFLPETFIWGIAAYVIGLSVVIWLLRVFLIAKMVDTSVKESSNFSCSSATSANRPQPGRCEPDRNMHEKSKMKSRVLQKPVLVIQEETFFFFSKR